MEWLKSIPLDKWMHFVVSVLLFIIVHYVTGNSFLAFGIASIAHIVKKGYDIYNGLRDKADIFGDVGAGILGALAAWACIFTY